MRTMSHQIKNTNQEIEIIFKKTQIKIPELKSTIIDTKNSLKRLTSRFEQVEERINDLKIGELKLSSLRSRKKYELVLIRLYT